MPIDAPTVYCSALRHRPDAPRHEWGRPYTFPGSHPPSPRRFFGAATADLRTSSSCLSTHTRRRDGDITDSVWQVSILGPRRHELLTPRAPDAECVWTPRARRLPSGFTDTPGPFRRCRRTGWERSGTVRTVPGLPNRIGPVLSRVMTFYSESKRLTEVVESLRADLPPAYEALPGFRGLLVLEKPGTRNHVIALTLWDDEQGVEASEALADTIADRIAAATGTSVTRNIYTVMGKDRDLGAERRRVGLTCPGLVPRKPVNPESAPPVSSWPWPRRPWWPRGTIRRWRRD